jgi:hypothetical protein
MAKGNELVNVSKQMIASNEEMTSFLQQLKDQTIPLFPDTVNFGVKPEFKLSATLVKVDVNNPRDVYPVDGGMVALHLNKINEIAHASDLKITASRILERTVDEHTGLVVYISHQVKWEMKSIDGTTKTGVATGKYDYYNDKATKTENQTKSRRKHAEALAESNALTRAFNKAIAKLPQSFSKAELSKPFLVPCVVQDTNELLKDLPEEVRNRLKESYAAKQLGVADQMYPRTSPSSSGSLPPHPKDSANPEDEKKGSVTMVKKNGKDINLHFIVSPDVEDAEFAEQVEPTLEEQNYIIAQEYKGMEQVHRTKKILGLVESKGYKDPKGVAITEGRVEKQSIENQVSFIERLLNMEVIDEDAEL